MTEHGSDGPLYSGSSRYPPLSRETIPAADAPYFPDICEFALTFNGYAAMAGFGPAAKLANSANALWHETGQLPDDLIELRTCLYFEQRRKHHLEQWPSSFPAEGEWMRYVRALVEAVRAKVVESESEQS